MVANGKLDWNLDAVLARIVPAGSLAEAVGGVDLVIEAVPGSRAVYTGEGSPDNRDYRVDFTKFATTFPEFEFKHTVKSGVQELVDGFEKHGMTEALIEGPRFIRLKTLKDKMGAFSAAVRA